MLNSVVLDLVWKAMIFFFVFSFILLFILIFIKSYFDYRKNKIQKARDRFLNLNIDDELTNFSNNTELFTYAQTIGFRLMETNNKKDREKLKQHIQTLKLSKRIISLYRRTHFATIKLYLLPIIAILSQKDAKLILYEIVNDKKNKNEISLNTWSLFGIALQTKTETDLYELYELLERFDRFYNVSQKYSQFFFIQAHYSMEIESIVYFLNQIISKEPNYVFIAYIYALQNLKYDYKIYQALLYIKKRYDSNSSLLVAILRTLHNWTLKEDYLILKYYKNKDDLVRIVCSKIGLEMMTKENYHQLICYLYDPSPYVRQNFLISLAMQKVELKEVIRWIRKANPQYIKDPLAQNSLMLYRQGVL